MQDFWSNVSRYPRYFVTVLLGVVLNAIAPLVPLMRKPITAIALVTLLVACLVFVSFTLRAMLGFTIVPTTYPLP